MPERFPHTLTVSFRGWGEKKATFLATIEEAKNLADVLSNVFREGVTATIQTDSVEGEK